MQAKGIVKRFGGLTAVDHVNFDLQPQEIHAVIGPNGAGKTTFLATLAGDHSPTEGRVFVNGADITALPVRARTKLGVGRTYQRSAVIGGFTALDMVRLAALPHSGGWLGYLSTLQWERPRDKNCARHAARVGLADREPSSPMRCRMAKSGGSKSPRCWRSSRTSFCSTNRSQDLVPDESHAVVDLVRDLKQHCSIVLIEHDIDVVFAIADRITVSTTAE